MSFKNVRWSSQLFGCQEENPELIKALQAAGLTVFRVDEHGVTELEKYIQGKDGNNADK